jgi:hypothetical protein
MGLLDNTAPHNIKTEEKGPCWKYDSRAKTACGSVDYGHTSHVTSYDVLQNNDALLHGLFHLYLLHSYRKPSVIFIYLSTAIWWCYAALYAWCSTLSSASTLTWQGRHSQSVSKPIQSGSDVTGTYGVSATESFTQSHQGCYGSYNRSGRVQGRNNVWGQMRNQNFSVAGLTLTLHIIYVPF